MSSSLLPSITDLESHPHPPPSYTLFYKVFHFKKKGTPENIQVIVASCIFKDNLIFKTHANFISKGKHIHVSPHSSFISKGKHILVSPHSSFISKGKNILVKPASFISKGKNVLIRCRKQL